MAASDTEYDQLRRENISTILSYGDSFMDLVCRDACDGLDVGRVCRLSFELACDTVDDFGIELFVSPEKHVGQTDSV